MLLHNYLIDQEEGYRIENVKITGRDEAGLTVERHNGVIVENVTISENDNPRVNRRAMNSDHPDVKDFRNKVTEEFRVHGITRPGNHH